VVIKGGQGDDAVLCTDDKTFALKYVETTNTLLLLPPDECGDAAYGAVASLTPPDASCLRDTGLQTQLQKAQRAADNPPLMATATVVAHIEVRAAAAAVLLLGVGRRLDVCCVALLWGSCLRCSPNRPTLYTANTKVVRCPPRLHQLRELLGSCRPYGIEDEQTDPDPSDQMQIEPDQPRWKHQISAAAAAGGSGKGGDSRGGSEALGFTMDQLLELVQSSKAELSTELHSLNAVCLNGRWRLVDEEYMGRLLEVVLLRWVRCVAQSGAGGEVPLTACCGDCGDHTACHRHPPLCHAPASNPTPKTARPSTTGTSPPYPLLKHARRSRQTATARRWCATAWRCMGRR